MAAELGHIMGLEHVIDKTELLAEAAPDSQGAVHSNVTRPARAASAPGGIPFT
jgi:hypothetical protein